MRDTIDYDPAVHQTDAGDKQLAVTFYMHYIRDEKKTEEEGRPIFKDTPFVKIFMPGDRNNIIDRPIRDTDQFRFPVQWSRFKAGQEQRATGMPLEEWSVITKAVAEELKFFGFQTVEQLAGANDEVCSKRFGLSDLRQKASAYLQVAGGDTKPLAAMSNQIDELKSQNEVLQGALSEMRAQLAELQKAKK